MWIDLARGGLGAASPTPSEIPAAWDTELPDEVVYLPPVSEAQERQRTRLAASLTEHGVPVLLQRSAGPADEVDAESVVVDLLEALLAGELDLLEELPTASRVVWPLISGLTDDRSLWVEGLAALESAGVGHVQPLALDLRPADKRRLVERVGEDFFHALFHGEQPSEQAFSRLAAERGFGPFLPRSLPAGGAKRQNQRLSEQLATAGELWLRVGRSESGGQDLYRSSRWVDREGHDLSTLCREGNLGVVPWLDPLSSRVITEFVTTGTAALVQELEAEYLNDTT